jgi:hypothetical protein
MNIFTYSELLLNGDREFSILADDLLDLGSESIVRINLLLNKSVLPEVAVEDLP